MTVPPESLHTRGPANQPAAPTSVRWHIVALLLAFSFMSWFNRVSMPVAYDEKIKEQYGISEEDIGWVYSAFLIAYTVFMTPGGWFADRFGAKRALVLVGFGSALFGFLTGTIGLLGLEVAAVLLLFLLIRSAMGVFTAPIYPASGRIVAHWIPFSQRARVNGMITGAALVGIASTYWGFGALLDQFDWPTAFLISGTVTGLFALAWTLYARDYPWQHPGVNRTEIEWIHGNVPGKTTDPPATAAPGPPQAGSWITLLENRSLMLLTVSYAAIGYFEYLFFFWMHYYFDQQLKMSKADSRLYSTLLYLAMAAGMVLGGQLSDLLLRIYGYRLGRALVVVNGMGAGAVLLSFGVLAQDPVWIVTWFALALAAVGATEGPFWATAIELGGRHGGTSAGIFNTGGNAGGAVAPVLTPLVSQYFGWHWGIGLGSFVCVAGLSLWLWIDPAERVEEEA